MYEIGKKSKIAFEKLKVVDHKKIKKVLHIFSSKILKSKKQILRENQKDLKKVKLNKAKLAQKDQKKLLENLQFVGSNNKVNIIILYILMFATLLYLSFQFFE